MSRRTRTSPAVALIALALVCPAGTALAGDPYATAPPYLRPVAPNVTLTPIVTVGQQVPVIGNPGALFRFVGHPDGLGVFGGGGTLTLLANHEFSRSQGAAAGPLPSGSRVSELEISYTSGASPTATVQSGRNYIDAVYAGEPSVLVAPGTRRIGRLCSAFLAGPATGFDRPMLLHGEEASGTGTFDGQGGSAFATFDRSARQLPRVGRAQWENIVALPGTGTTTALVALEDGSSSGDGHHSQLYLYVGTKMPGATDPLTRNGLDNGQLYVLASDDPSRNRESTFNVKNTSVMCHWSAVNHAQSDAALDAQSRTVGSFLFVRIEDGASDPLQTGDFYFVTTGRSGSANAFGRLYRLRFDPGNPAGGTTLTLLLDGSEGIISPDNIDINGRGEMLLCEDPTYNLETPPLNLTRDAYLWRYTIPTTQLTAIAEIDRAAAVQHALAADPMNANSSIDNGPGDWEVSGVVDAEAFTGPGTWILDVMAHSLRINPTVETIQGGQVLLVHIPLDVAAVVSGLEIVETPEGVRLAWDATVEVEAFEVWRASSSDGPWTNIAGTRLPRDARTWLDEAPTGVWYYRVDALAGGVIAASAGPYRIEVHGGRVALALFQTAIGTAPGEATLVYTIPAGLAGTYIRLALFDVAGRFVDTLYEGPATAGRHETTWRPQRGASGTYFGRLETVRGMRTARVTILR
jgi:hypothetical protein